jgi:serine/threonine-protein kinase
MTDRRPPLELADTLATNPPGFARDTLPSVSTASLRADGPRYAEPRLLGRGGMGEVHLRRDAWLGRSVAVKTLMSERASSEVARARFLREARVQGQLEHPAIVPVYDVGVDEGGQEYFTMKRVTGRTLEEVLFGGELPRSRLLGLFRQVCLAIDYAHARGVVHRDLKPANVMIGDFGEVYVLDWGLAKLLAKGSSIDEPADDSQPGAQGETLTGQVLGTPGYMAPEQIASANDADERADVYALGAILFEILARRPLHEGSSVSEVLRSTQAGTPARPSKRAPELDVPPELDALCEKATARDPAERGVTARDIAVAIERFLEGDRDLVARRTLAVRHAEVAAAAASEALSGGPGAISSRARALKEAGRALTLDPENIAGAATLLRLIAQPPPVLPDEVRDEVEHADREAMRLRNRKGIGILFVFLVLVLLLPPVCGVRSWPLLACVIMPIGMAFVLSVAVLVSRGLTVQRFETRTDWVVGLGLVGVACCSLVVTSCVLVPVVALTFAVGAAGAARTSRRVPYMTMGLAAFLVPFVFEWAHLAPAALPGLQFVSGGALIPATAIDLPEIPFRVLLLAATCASMLAPSLTVFPVLDAAAALRRQSFLQAWHLRQLAPMESPTRRSTGPAP